MFVDPMIFEVVKKKTSDCPPGSMCYEVRRVFTYCPAGVIFRCVPRLLDFVLLFFYILFLVILTFVGFFLCVRGCFCYI